MIDVHVPHKSEHTWTDFFIHIGTIAVGLLLAIGLEQGVEFVHHRHQRHELQQQLQADAQKTVQETALADRNLTAWLHYLRACMTQVKASLNGRKLPDPTRPTLNQGFDVPQDSVWQAAKADGTVAVLPAEDIRVFSELNEINSQLVPLFTAYLDSSFRAGNLKWSLTRDGAHALDIESLTADQKREYLDALMQEYDMALKVRFAVRPLRGGSLAVARGERNLAKVQLTERQFDNQP